MVEQGRPLPGSVATPSGSFHPYPAPLAKYEDVVANRQLFMTTLEKLHTHMGTKFMIPIIGGRDLDLHKLFLEVTSRGGIDKILREKRWKDVTATFNFPSTATNASFVLRKYYYSLLQHYERLYYFKAQGWTLSPTGILQSPTTTPVAAEGSAKMSQAPVQVTTVQQQPKNTKEFVSGAAGAASSASAPVIGVIDGKFESGYLVTVNIGNKKLKGVLYQAPSAPPNINQGPQSSGVSTGKTDSATPSTSGMHLRRRRRRKKSEIRKRDPDHPKPNRSGYNFFFAEQHARLKPLHPGKDREISRMIGELWNKLKGNERAVYQDKAMKDKERYRKEMVDYRERLRSNQVISDAVPIQQRFPNLDVHMVEAGVKDGTTGRDFSQTPEDESHSSKSETEEEEEEEDDDDDDDGDDDDDDDFDYEEIREKDDDETLSDNETYQAPVGIGVGSANVGTSNETYPAPVGVCGFESGNVVGTSEASAAAGGDFQVVVKEDEEKVCEEREGSLGGTSHHNHTPGEKQQNAPLDIDAQHLTSIPPTIT